MISVLRRDAQLFGEFVEAQAEDLGDALLLHGDAVEDIGGFHRAAAVGDDDELGLVAEGMEVAGEALDVAVVQRGVDLVEHAERRGPDLEDGEIERDGDEGLLAAGEQRDGLDLLAGRLDADALIDRLNRLMEK